MFMKLYEPTKELELAEGVFKTSIKGLWYVERKQFEDERGYFAEVGHTHKLENLSGEEFKVKQINHSQSKQNVVRGMHAEDWKKLIFVTTGVSFSAMADVRPESDTFKQVVNFKLGFGEGALKGGLFISPGIANSVCVLKGPVEYIYLVDKLYKDRDPAGDVAVSMFDKDLAIEWPLKREEMIISKRDTEAVNLREKFPDKF